MKLKETFITSEIDGEILLVPVGGEKFSGVVRGNRTFGAILELLGTETTEAEIVAGMKARFDAPEEIITRDVKKALSELRKIGALDE